MAGRDSPPQTTPLHATLGPAPKHITTANDPLADFPGGGAGAFDPRESFYPKTLLKAEDLRVSLPRPVRRTPRFVKPLVAVLLAIGAALAYVFFLQPQPPETKQAESPDRPAGNPGASGVIATPVSVTVPLPAAPAKAPSSPASPASASVAKAAPVPRAAAAPPRQSPAASAPTPTSALVLPPGARPVTHTKAAAESAEPAAGADPGAPAPTVVATPPAAIEAPRRSNCSAELTALGLCSPATQGQPGK